MAQNTHLAEFFSQFEGLVGLNFSEMPSPVSFSFPRLRKFFGSQKACRSLCVIQSGREKVFPLFARMVKMINIK